MTARSPQGGGVFSPSWDYDIPGQWDFRTPPTINGDPLSALPLGVVYAADYGVVAGGLVDNADMLDAALAACHTTGAAASTTRVGTSVLQLPPGVILTTRPWVFTSIQNLTVRGYPNTRLRAGADMDAVLDLNGVAYSLFEDLWLDTDAGFTVQNMVRMRWTTAASRSMTQNTYRRVMVFGQFVNGFSIGGGPGAWAGRQVDNDDYHHCYVAGAWTAGEATLWQTGFLVGEGTSANNLNHSFYHIQAINCRYPLFNDNTNLQVFGGDLTGGEIAYFHKSANNSTLTGIRSEGCQQLLKTGGPTSAAYSLSMRDIRFNGESMTGAGKWIHILSGGNYRFSNVTLISPAVTGVIELEPSGVGAGTGGLQVHFANLQTPYVLANTYVTVAGKVGLRFTGYLQVVAGVATAGTLSFETS